MVVGKLRPSQHLGGSFTEDRNFGRARARAFGPSSPAEEEEETYISPSQTHHASIVFLIYLFWLVPWTFELFDPSLARPRLFARHLRAVRRLWWWAWHGPQGPNPQAQRWSHPSREVSATKHITGSSLNPPRPGTALVCVALNPKP